MSIRSTQDIAAFRPETPGAGTNPRRQERNGLEFSELLASSSPLNRIVGESGKKAAKTAEIFQLEMMRSALCMDGSPPPVRAFGSGQLNNLLAAYGIEEQKTTALSGKDDGAASSAEGSAAAVNRAPQTVPHGNANPDISEIVSRASKRYGVAEGLIKAVIQAESNFKTTAVSSAGAQGLMQLMPATAAGLGVTDSFNPEQNVMAGTRFLKDMLTRYGGDIDKALAAYNWGPGNLERGNGRLPRETQDYLVKVKKYYSDYGTG